MSHCIFILPCPICQSLDFTMRLLLSLTIYISNVNANLFAGTTINTLQIFFLVFSHHSGESLTSPFFYFLIFRLPMSRDIPRSLPDPAPLRWAKHAGRFAYNHGPTILAGAGHAALAYSAADSAFSRAGQLSRGIFATASLPRKVGYLAGPAAAAVSHARGAFRSAKSIVEKVPQRRFQASRPRTWIHTRRVSARPRKYVSVFRRGGRRSVNGLRRQYPGRGRLLRR